MKLGLEAMTRMVSLCADLATGRTTRATDQSAGSAQGVERMTEAMTEQARKLAELADQIDAWYFARRLPFDGPDQRKRCLVRDVLAKSDAFAATAPLEDEKPQEDTCPPRRRDDAGIGGELVSLPPVAQAASPAAVPTREQIENAVRLGLMKHASAAMVAERVQPQLLPFIVDAVIENALTSHPVAAPSAAPGEGMTWRPMNEATKREPIIYLAD